MVHIRTHEVQEHACLSKSAAALHAIRPQCDQCGPRSGCATAILRFDLRFQGGGGQETRRRQAMARTINSRRSLRSDVILQRVCGTAYRWARGRVGSLCALGYASAVHTCGSQRAQVQTGGCWTRCRGLLGVSSEWMLLSEAMLRLVALTPTKACLVHAHHIPGSCATGMRSALSFSVALVCAWPSACTKPIRQL